MTRTGGTQYRTTVARGLVVVGTLAFLAASTWYLARPGFTLSRLGAFLVLGVLAVLGAAGVLWGRDRLSALAAVALFLLGFWQAVLWILIWGQVGVLVAATVLDGADRARESGDGAGDA